MSGKGIDPVGAPRDAAITIGPFKPSRPGYGPVLSYLQAAQLDTPLKIHPLLQLRTWDPKPYAKYLAWNVIEHPMFAAIWVDYDGIKERGQPATSPIVEEINIGHVETGWSIRVRNRMGITCEDVLFAIYDFFASPLYVDELGEMHPRAVRIMEQQYFEKRRMGFFDLMEGYRKSDALLGQTYFDGYVLDLVTNSSLHITPGMTFEEIHNDQESVERLKKKYNFHSANLLLLRLGNC
uniref:DUF6699 domain-containing protein n=1 Tax=Kwoniella bestiolae CBS 10118 TaxID=1296100 RepID=A0A1B9FZM6_9TREE|nr:hypothetical protein I302_05679 [Kwoniella bestiolae CBS 10118]OCF24220.1 hypothetical protein I302_05679 [Kwoniella bestiolae CBS 10118]